MEERTDINESLNNAITQRKAYIDKNQMSRLKEKFRHFHTSYQNIYKVLLKKGAIPEDPYKDDFKISEVTTPDKDTFLDSERAEKMSIRLSQYDTILDFLTQYYQFSADFLNLKRLKKMGELLTYFQWTKLNPNSTNLNTRTLADFILSVKAGGDQFSTNILSDACNQLSKLTGEIIGLLKEITAFSRQLYKQDIRERILFKIHISTPPSSQAMEEAFPKIKRAFPQELPDTPFFPELVNELIAEEFSPQGQKLKEDLINSLTIKEKTTQKQEDVSYKSLLMETLRIFSGASIHLEKALAKLNETQTFLDQRQQTFGERFRRWVMNMVQKKSEKHIYMVDFFDEKTATTRSVRIDYDAFAENTLKRARTLGILSSKVSSTYMRLESSEEEKIYEYIITIVEDLQKILTTLPALDTYFKSEVPREMRSRVRGIKLEITAVKNVLIRANQKRHEYVSKKEEITQLKKLGVDTSVS